MEEAAQILEIETFIPLLLQVRINFNSIKTNFQENDIFVAQRLRREKFAGLKCEIICYNSHNFSSRITGMSLGFSDKWLTMASITNPCLKKLLVKFHLIIELVQFSFFFASNKNNFWHLQSSLHLPSSLHLHSTYLTYFSLPALPTSQPLFFLSQYLHVPCEP